MTSFTTEKHSGRIYITGNHITGEVFVAQIKILWKFISIHMDMHPISFYVIQELFIPLLSYPYTYFGYAE